ncbi:ATP-binding protein [Pedobacter sp. UC225_65]|uniref:sensor histidine kinase n=1 Tax=Pedobacter sp. UC225_65 TaxID=3350173 RepID=UPI00367098E4
MRFSLVLVVLCFLLNQAIAQNYSLSHYTDENGLPQNSVKSITTDNAGFVWLATENGLVRYDGQKFVLFDKNYAKTSSNRIANFRIDVKTNSLYALSENWQLINIKDGHVAPSSLTYSKVFNFKNGSKDDYNYANGVPNAMEKYVLGMPYIIVIDKNTVYKIQKGIIEQYLNEVLVRKIPFDYKDQWRFFVLDKKLYYIDEKRKLTCFIDGKQINTNITGELAKITSQHAGTLFWNTCTGNVFLNIKNALYTLEKSQKTGHFVTKCIIKDVDLEDLSIISIYLDQKSGHIYMGSSTKGLYVYRKKDFNTLNPIQSTSSNLFYAQVPYGQNSVLYANGYLFQNTGNTLYFDLLKKHSSNFSLLIDHHKNVWSPNGTTLYKFSPELTKILAAHPFPYRINSIYQSPDAELWVGTFNGIYKMAKSDTSFKRVDVLSGIKDVSYLQKTGQLLWIGTHKGMYYYNFVNRAKYSIPELANKDIRSVYTRGNEVWITTYGDGFYLYREGKITRLPNDNNNYLNTSHCILEDKHGFFWISTNKGLFQVAIADLLAYADQKTSNVFYLYYNRASGFNTNEFNGGCQPCGSIMGDGNFSFPSMNGMVLFNPSRIIANEPDQPIFLDKAVVDNQLINSDGTSLSIPNEFNRLNIFLTTPYFGNSENLNFEYKLSNQKQWTQSIDQIISYSSLPSGKNILNIRKVSGFGQDNYVYKNITIIVPPHMYQNWWFILGAIILAALILYLYIKVRIRIIRKRNLQLEESISERTHELQNTIKAYETSQKRLEQHGYFQRRLIAAITHDIKSPLKYLMITGESLYNSSTHNEIDRDGLKAMFTSSSQIYHFTENLLTYAKGFTNEDLNVKTTFNLSRLIEEKIAIFQGIANSQGTTIHNLIHKEVQIETNEQLLSVILHNLIDNSVKFTNVGEISFSFQVNGDKISIFIKDTGIGMKPYQVLWCNKINDPFADLNDTPLHAGLGLIMVKELIKAIGGKIYVVATLGRGTTVEIIL